MSEHTPLTEVERAWQEYEQRPMGPPPTRRQAFEAGFLAARTSTATAAEFCEHGFRPEPGRCPAGCTEATHTRFGEPSTATADTCPGCGHPTHGDDECGAVVGYDHLNGDHECGCPGPEALGDLVDAATADTGLREWVRSLPDKIREYADLFEGQQREDIARAAVFVEFALPFALDATAAPTTDTGARDE